MCDNKPAPLRDRLNAWTQTIGIVAAGIWGLYAFVYKEIRTPRTAPINVSVDLKLQQYGTEVLLSADQSRLCAVELTISARNPSSRTVKLLPSAFIVNGFRYAGGNSEFGRRLIEKPIPERTGVFSQLHVHSVDVRTVAVGNAVADDTLKPNESVTRNLVIYVPLASYDMLEAVVAFPTAEIPTTLDVDWTVDTTKGALVASYYFLEKAGERKPISPEMASTMDGGSEFQVAWTRAQLALSVPHDGVTLEGDSLKPE